MSWSKFFGDIAKDIAKEYYNERGSQGVIEDLGSVASGVKNFFSSDSDDSDEDELIDTYNEYIENEEYLDAIKFVRDYYKDNRIKVDYIYNYLIGSAMVDLSLDKKDLSKATESLNCLKKAKGSCPIGTEAYGIVSERLKEAEEAISTLKEEEAFIARWNTTIDKVARLRDECKFDKASTVLLEYYKKYEKGEFDSYYWMEMAEIRYCNHLHTSVPSEAEQLYKEFIRALQKAERLTDNEDSLERINLMKKWEKNDIADPQPEVPTSNTSNEQEYLAELQACLADNEISERERRLLDRLRISLGISEQRAKELEAQCKNNGLTEQEREYLEELKLCMEDGMISEKEERLLHRLRKSLGISDEREAALRKMVK